MWGHKKTIYGSLFKAIDRRTQPYHWTVNFFVQFIQKNKSKHLDLDSTSSWWLSEWIRWNWCKSSENYYIFSLKSRYRELKSRKNHYFNFKNLAIPFRLHHFPCFSRWIGLLLERHEHVCHAPSRALDELERGEGRHERALPIGVEACWKSSIFETSILVSPALSVRPWLVAH